MLSAAACMCSVRTRNTGHCVDFGQLFPKVCVLRGIDGNDDPGVVNYLRRSTKWPKGATSPILHLRASVIGAGLGEQQHSDWMRGSVARRGSRLGSR
jgi:hypothetical protein